MATESVPQAIKPTDSESLGEIAVLYNASAAIIQSIYDAMNASDNDSRRRKNQAYGLVIALDTINDEIGKHAGVI